MNDEYEHESHMPTEAELRGIFKAIGEEVPGLLERLTKILYGLKEGEEFGKAIGNFYKALKEAGMSEEQAFRLTQEYMSNVNLGKMFWGWGEGMQRMDGRDRSKRSWANYEEEPQSASKEE